MCGFFVLSPCSCLSDRNDKPLDYKADVPSSMVCNCLCAQALQCRAIRVQAVRYRLSALRLSCATSAIGTDLRACCSLLLNVIFKVPMAMGRGLLRVGGRQPLLRSVDNSC